MLDFTLIICIVRGYTRVKKVVNIFAYKDLINHCTVDLDGRHHLESNCVYIFNHSINIKSLVLTGDIELRGRPKSDVTITLTSPGVSISSYDLNLFTLRNLKIKSKSKTSLFDLRGAIVRLSNCVLRARRLGRVDLKNLSIHDVIFNGFNSGFTIVKLSTLVAKYLRGTNLTGAFIDLSGMVSKCKVTMKDLKLVENINGNLELIRVETKVDNNTYVSPNIEDPDLFELKDIELSVKSVNSYKTILSPRDKIITGYCYRDDAEFIYQPYRFTNRIDLSAVSSRSIYG